MIIEIKTPIVGESVTEVTVGEWKKPDGALVAADEIICLIESEKATMEVAAPGSGKLKISAQTGETKKIGAVIATIDTSVTAAGTETPAPPADPANTPAPGRDRVLLTSVAKQILHEKGIPAETVPGTGDAGRITKADALKAVSNLETPPVSPTPTPPSAMPTGDREEKHERMSTLRRTIARRLVEAKNSAAMLTTINEADMSAIIKLRDDLREDFFNKYGVKPGFVSLFAKAICIALKDMPVINARVEGDDIITHSFIDLSIAVSTPRGLVVPVVRNAHLMSVAELEKSVQTLAGKARDGKLTLEEMTGGTFTITNGGVFGSLISTPIINAPQSAVLGMHAVQDRPIALNGQVVIRPMMYISLSYDHRIIDGRESVLFLVHVKSLLENPNRMLLEL